MNAEVVAVGTELLLGQLVDTNSAWLGEHLAAAGIDSYFQTKVGDNHARIVSALRAALGRADAVIVCGGLGPTHDDITREAIAEVMGVPLVPDPLLAERIAGMFAARGRTMPANNARQALVPSGARPISQARGTAPGLICPVGGKVIYALPGPPEEMAEMAERAVISDLVARAGSPAVIASRVLRVWGLAESRVAELAGPYIDALEGSGVTLALLANRTEGIRVRLTLRAPTRSAAEQVLDGEEARLRTILGEHVFGVDEVTMEAAVGAGLAGRGLTLGLAESVTGGMIGSRLVGVPGASEWFRGSVVAYSPGVKRSVLAVPEGPVVSAAAALAMALGARKVLEADIGVGVSGVAGPGAEEGVAVGTVFCGFSGPDPVPGVQRLELRGDREQIRRVATMTVLDTVRRWLA